MNNTFTKLHPTVNLIYFIFTIGFTMFIMNPICLAVSFLCSFVTALNINGGKAIKLSLFYLLPIMILTIIITPLFNHQGVTIISYFPWGNPITLESILYAVSASVMLISTILWFSCFNRVMTSDKLIYLFGRITPSLSLIISMVLRFIPKFSTQFRLVSTAQKAMGRDISNGNLIVRIKNCIRIFSILITWSLENAIETSDSMKSRGYGLKNKTAYSLFKFKRKDMIYLSVIFLSGLTEFYLLFIKSINFRYYPSIKGELISVEAIAFYLIYFSIMSIPLITNIGEGIRWKRLQSKI